MKFLIVLMLAVSASQAFHLQRGLAQDLQDFMDILPLDKLQAIFDNYSQNDAEVKAILAYAQSQDVKDAIADVYSIEEIQLLIEWILTNLSLKHTSHKASPLRMTRGNGWNGMVEEILAALPLNDLMSLVLKKVSEGGTFAQLVNKIKGGQAVYEQIITTPSVVKIIKNFMDLGINLPEYDQLIRSIFGWN